MSLDWKWLFIYPDQGVASVNELVVPAGVPLHFTLTSASVLNTFFVPQLGSMIYTMNGMATELYLHADDPGTYHGLSAHFSGDGFSDMHFAVRALPADAVRRLGRDDPRGAGARSTPPATPRSRGRASSRSPILFSAVEADLFDRIVRRRSRRAPGPGARTRRSAEARNDMWGKLSWDAIPLHEPLPLLSAAVVGAGAARRSCAWIVAKGHLPYLWKEWLTQRRPQAASASCTSCSRW